jgi:tetratricopeptide (TPR) repeat protein
LVLGAVHVRKSQPIAALGVAWFFLGVLPTSSVVPSPDLLFEHRAYVSLAGFAMAAAALLGRLRESAPARAAWVAVAAVAVLGALTARRVGVWDSEASLWSDVVAKSPGKARPRVNLGLALERSGRYADAETQYREAVALEPANALALNNLGNVLGRRGSFEEAEVVLRAAHAADARLAQPTFNLGNIAMERGDYEEAEAFYRRAIRLGLSAPVVLRSLAASVELQERTAGAGEGAGIGEDT